jgi:DNA-directed RNA polymerase specialized sigma24 family protein
MASTSRRRKVDTFIDWSCAANEARSVHAPDLDEIAVVSGLSPEVVRVRLHRARRQLQALLRRDPRE